MIRKLEQYLLCVLICLAVALFLPHLGTSHEKVTGGGCLLSCHIDYEIMSSHSTLDCTDCHEGETIYGNVYTAICIECHPTAGEKSQCGLVNYHVPDKDADCLACHGECNPDITTTTTTGPAITTTTTIAESCTPMQEALDSLNSDGEVTVKKVEVEEPEGESYYYYAFKPNKGQPKIGFIIYGGGYAVAEAYAPSARGVAIEGFLTFCVKMKDDLAILSPERAKAIIEDYQEIETWVIGGHSLGGVTASIFAIRFPDMVDGIVLWASYPSEQFRLDNTDLKVLSIYGTKDGVTTLDETEESKQHLPPDTQFVPIEGANHGQFSWCDKKPRDYDIPEISREEQQDQINEITVNFLREFQDDVCPVEYLLGEGNPQLNTIRQFRDEVLSKTITGQELIRLYYQWSPLIINVMDADEDFKEDVREMVDELLLMIAEAVE